MISSLLLAHGNGFAQLSPSIEALGWTLLHFVWQAAALGLALTCFLAAARRASPAFRYLAGCSALALMALAAAGTFAWQMAAADARATISMATTHEDGRTQQPPPDGTLGSAHADAVVGRSSDAAHVTAAEADLTQIAEPVPKQGTSTRRIAAHAMPKNRTAPADDSGHSIPPPQGVSTEPATSAGSISGTPPIVKSLPFVNADQLWNSKERLLTALEPWLPWIVGLWTCGVGLLALRLAVGWGIIRNLKRQGEAPKDRVWHARIERLRVRVGVSAPVRLLCSTTATVPMVIGWLRPVVLVPAGLLAGLTPHQLEAVLAHELAHIRRHDYLVNLLQNIVETFFFYHPAVWWISRQIRTEREHCCDDLAAAVCGSTLDYARALTALAELRHTSGVFGLAATGGSLVNRIARLAGVGNPEPRLGWPLPAFLLTAGTAVAFVATSAASPRGDALKAAPAAKTSPQLIQGHVLDPAGKPVADAAVWLTAWDAKAYPFDGIPIVAQCRSTADGQFVLSLDAATVRNLADSRWSQVEIWVRKPGLSLAYERRRGGLPTRALEIRLRPEERVVVRFLNPDGSPGTKAHVTPTVARFYDEVMIPHVIQEELASRTAADGRVELCGLCADEIAALQFQSSAAGIQCCLFPNWDWPDSKPADVVLRKTGTLEGRLVLPEGSQADFTSAKVRVMTKVEAIPGGRTTWSDRLTIRPDHSGKFTASRVPEGSVSIFVEVPGDFDCRPDERQTSKDAKGHALKMTAAGSLKVDIPMTRNVRVKGIVRDARTKQPVGGVRSVVFCKSGNERLETWSDDQGRFSFWIPPYLNYQMNVELPAGFARVLPASDIPISADASPPEQEMPPIELIRSRSVEGIVVDSSGRPFGGVDVAAGWGRRLALPGTPYLNVTDAQKWTTADAQGHFRFDDLANEEEVTLTPVRSGIVLGEPLKIGSKTEQPVQLAIRKVDFAAIAGRVMDHSGYPVEGADVAVELLHNGEPAIVWRGRTNTFGRYETAALFPKGPQYRVTVRSRCKAIATSIPRRLSNERENIDDLLVFPFKAFDLDRLTGSEVVARVNGAPILASQALSRATSLPRSQSQPFGLAFPLRDGRTLENDYREHQDAAIRRVLPDVIKTQLMAQALLDNLEPAQRGRIEQAIANMFDEYVLKLEGDLKVSSRWEADEKLKRQGTSLVELRNEFRLRNLADEWRRSTDRQRHVDIKAMEAFYKAHGEEYSVPEKVRWRLLEIQFERHGGRDKARSVAERALAELRRGDDFKAVVRKYSDGRRIDDKQLSVNRDPATSYSYQASDVTVDSVIGDIGVYGNGCSRIRIEALESQMVSCRADASKPVRLDLTTVRVAGPLDSAIPPKKPRNDDTPRYVEDGKDFWTRPASVADRKLSETLNQLEPGQISGILEGPDSYRIVHLIERQRAARLPFDEVANEIREKLADQLRQQFIDDLYRRASIESPYYPTPKTQRRLSDAEKFAQPGIEYLPAWP